MEQKSSCKTMPITGWPLSDSFYCFPALHLKVKRIDQSAGE